MRQTLAVIWAALLCSVVTFTGVAWFLGPSLRSPLPEPFMWTMLGVAVLNASLSRVVPALLKGPEQTKAIIAFAFAESAAMISGITWMLTGATAAFGGIVLGLVALASLFPRDKRDGETVNLIPK